MFTLNTLLQIIIAVGLLNVWIFRNSKATQYRGGEAKTLKDEFKAYGLPEIVYYIVGFLKITSAIALIASIWMPSLTLYAASIVTFLMIGALAMHFKVNDPIKKSVPAVAMLVMSSFLIATPFIQNLII